MFKKKRDELSDIQQNLANAAKRSQDDARAAEVPAHIASTAKNQESVAAEALSDVHAGEASEDSIDIVVQPGQLAKPVQPPKGFTGERPSEREARIASQAQEEKQDSLRKLCEHGEVVANCQVCTGALTISRIRAFYFAFFSFNLADKKDIAEELAALSEEERDSTHIVRCISAVKYSNALLASRQQEKEVQPPKPCEDEACVAQREKELQEKSERKKSIASEGSAVREALNLQEQKEINTDYTVHGLAGKMAYCLHQHNHSGQNALIERKRLVDAEVRKQIAWMIRYAPIYGWSEYEAAYKLSKRLSELEDIFDHEEREKIYVEVMEYAVEDRIVNDDELAKLWVNSRGFSGDMGIVRIKHELEKKHIGSEIIEKYLGKLENVSSYDSALELLRKRGRRYDNVKDSKVKAKLFGFLSRRGFSYDVSYRAIAELGREQDEQSE